MEQYSTERLKRVHEIIFEILCDIDDYCRENNITWFLGGGTCLGAARHHGFIPWDDDGDIMMPRADYERFISGFAGAYADKYKTMSLQTWPQWDLPHAQIANWSIKRISTTRRDAKESGFGVDVFPMDGIPSEPSAQKRVYRRIKVLAMLRRVLILKEIPRQERHRRTKRMLGEAMRLMGITSQQIGRCIENYGKRFCYEASEYVGAITAIGPNPCEREKLSREDVRDTEYLPFEGRKLPVFNGYKHYLRNLYGDDYMEIPTDPQILGRTHLRELEVLWPDDLK